MMNKNMLYNTMKMKSPVTMDLVLFGDNRAPDETWLRVFMTMPENHRNVAIKGVI
jgi:hypothetical protein